jgi:hypothetical protein
MLDAQDQGQDEFIKLAIEKMPNFSEEIQTNNVLTKRILALKVKDGLHINMQEAEQHMKEQMKKATTFPTAFETDLFPVEETK